MNKRGQVTIFIIISLIIVSVLLIIFLLSRAIVATSETNPNSYLKSCIELEARSTLETISKQGGYYEPTNYILYQDEKIQHLCYTSEYYTPCVIQQPMLKAHMENEIKQRVTPVARQCLRDLKSKYEQEGYSVSLNEGDINVEFIPNSLLIEFDSSMTLTKQDTRRFSKFTVDIKSSMYDLIFTSMNVLQFESIYGDSEITLYLLYYPNLRIEKIKRDGSTIYKLKDVITNEEFVFASRSLVWPIGFGI